MQLFSYVNLHRLNTLVRLKDELQEIYLNQVIQTFALSLIGIFIPVYLIELGYDIPMVFNYYAIFSVMLAAFALVTANICTRIGLKHTILLSTVPLAIQYVLLQILGHYRSVEIFYTIPVIEGIWASLYWLPLHSEFIRHSHKKYEGNEIGNLFAFPKLASTFAPFFGAVILKMLGFDVLFIIVITLVMLSVVPLFFTKDSKNRFTFRLKNLTLLSRNNIHIYLIAEGIHLLVEVIIWPLFVYVMFRDMMSLGILATISSIGIIGFTLVVGRLMNRFASKKTLLRIGGVSYGLVLIMRAFVSNIFDVYVLSLLGSMASTMLIMAIYARFCDEARSGNIIAGVIARHFWLTLGRIVPIFLIVYFFGFEASLIICGLATIVLLLI